MIPAEAKYIKSLACPIIPHINRFIQKHPGTLSLGQGTVHYPPPEEAISCVSQIVRGSSHAYGQMEGSEGLRDAIISKLAKKNVISVGNEKYFLLVTTGGNSAFHATVMATCNAGDEVILLSPHYFNHAMTLEMHGCHPVYVALDKRTWHPNISKIKEKINEKTTAIVTVSPNNPCGSVFTCQELGAINYLCKETGIWHISDEAYEDFVYPRCGYHFSPASLEAADQHTISLYSFSKGYGMASWRVGYLLAPWGLRQAYSKIQDNILICPPLITQIAAETCLRKYPDYASEQASTLVSNRKLCQDAFNILADKGIIFPTFCQGALYFFLRLRRRIDDYSLAIKLIQEYRVAVLPGSSFSVGPYSGLRVSFGALAKDVLEQAIDRLVKGLTRLAS